MNKTITITTFKDGWVITKGSYNHYFYKSEGWTEQLVNEAVQILEELATRGWLMETPKPTHKSKKNKLNKVLDSVPSDVVLNVVYCFYI